MPEGRKPKLVDQVREAIRLRHYSWRTEQIYVHWIKRFILFHHKRHPLEMGKQEVGQFLSALAVERQVSASTQNQALCALLLLSREVLARKLGWLDNIILAKQPQRLPIVLTRPEGKALLSARNGTPWLMATLLYGAGLRLSECLHLRVKDVDFNANQIVVREGKGNKDRITMFPTVVRTPLTVHLKRVHALHQHDLERGFGNVALPDALSRKYPQAEQEWGWQGVFPASSVSVDPHSGVQRRPHLQESVLQRAPRKAAQQKGFTKPVSCHSLRHSFAPH